MAWAPQQGRSQAASLSSASLRAPCRALPPEQNRRLPGMLPWLSQLASWLRGGQPRLAAAGAAAPAALSSSEQAAVDAAAAAKPNAEHLIVMVHGLFGTRDNWRAIRQLLEEHLDSEATALCVSHCNERQKVGGAGRAGGMPEQQQRSIAMACIAVPCWRSSAGCPLCSCVAFPTLPRSVARPTFSVVP